LDGAKEESGVTMNPNIFSTSTTGWWAIATGSAGLLGLAFIILFFTRGQPFGTLNDICIGLAAVLSGVLAWMLYPEFQARSPQLGQIALILALAGAIIVVVGSVLVISGTTGWFLAGLYMATGNALIGLWLLALNYIVQPSQAWPQGLVIFGLVVSVIMALGLATAPGIFRGTDAWASAPWYVNYVGQAGALGWLIAYPVWCIWLGRILLLK
jgi:hypothetical protein